jgi:endonuclease YncB( thermonuclease family)
MTERISPAYTYAAEAKRLVDGDTLEMHVDLGCYTWVDITVRLLGVNCPEARGPSRAAGLLAKEATRQWLASHTDLVVITRKDPRSRVDSFRRYLATVKGDNAEGLQEDLAQHLLATHNAVPFKDEPSAP